MREVEAMLQDLFEFETCVPAWLRQTYRGALFIPGMASRREGKLLVGATLAMLLLLLGPVQGLVFFGKLGLVAIGAGAVAGTLHGVLRPVERWWPLGAWVHWTVVILGFGMTVVALTPGGPFTLREPTLYPVAAGFAALAGLAVVLLDDRRLGRSSPRKFRRLQSRERLWANARELRTRRMVGAQR
jgi:hypothetical protein